MRRGLWLGTPVLLTGLVVGPMGLSSAEGAEGFAGTFGAVASADAVRVTWVVPHAPASDTVLDFGGPSAQATLDSVGGSQAFASFPYPGENTVTAPALIAGASGGQINLPSYPFWVGSTYPVTPKSESGSGPYTIKAESTDTSSTSSASVGLDSNGQVALGLAKSQASTVAAPDGVTSQASSEVTAFAAGPLKIGQVISTAKAVFSGGTVTRDAATSISGAMVGDTPVAFTEKGLVVGSSPVPADPKPIADALAAAKIGVEFMPRQDTETGVVAPTIRVTQRDDAGQSITYVLGRTSAFAQGEGTETPATAEPADEPSTSPGETEPSGVPPPVAAVTPSPAEFTLPSEQAPDAPRVIDAAVSFVLPDPGPVPAVTEVHAPPPPPTVVQLAAGGRGRKAAFGLLISASDTTPMFAVLLIGLLAALTGAVLMGRLGKKTR
jgi:hypothetical protein